MGFLDGLTSPSKERVRRQNIWLRLGLRLAEFRPHHGVDIKRRSCGAASVDVG
jgi:hypothetical protein